MQQSINYNKAIGLKWVYLTEVVKGLPIFNFNILIRKHIQYGDIGINNQWIKVFELSSQDIEKLVS